MNKIQVKIEKIETDTILTIVTFVSKNHTLKMMSLELDENIREANEIILTTKATNIALAKDLSGILSHTNQLNVAIQNIEMGELLCAVELSFENSILESIITSDSAKRMHLQIGDRVTALIKSSDLSILESRR